MKMISITDIGGFKLGNAENSEKGTGCTVIICEKGAVGGVDVRGGGPATRETDLLRSENTVNAVNAVVLSGGSAFGLEAASGVMRELADMKIGFDAGDDIVVPIVCGASLYDLPVGDRKAFPDVGMGAQAVRNAYAGAFHKGNHGAGTGATVGKLKGYERAMKSGLGTFACGDGVIEVGAIAAVNAVGDIYNGAGNIIAGLRSEDGKSIYGTIKTLKGMVHDNDKVRQADESASFINRANIEEALAAVARQYEEEASAANLPPVITSVTEEEPETAAEVITEIPAEKPVAEFVFEAPADVQAECIPDEQLEEIPEVSAEGTAEEAEEEIAEEPVTEEMPEENPVEEYFEETAEAIIEEPAEEEEILEEPADSDFEEQAAEDIVEERPAEEVSEESEEESVEEFVPETPPVVDTFEGNYREYAEISIPVVTEEAGSAEETAEEPTDKAIEETAEAIIEEPAEEEIFEEPADSDFEEQAAEDFVEERLAEEYIEESIEEIAVEPFSETAEEPAEEITEEVPAEEFFEGPPEEINGLSYEENVEENPAEEFIEETIDENAEAVSEEYFEEPAREIDQETPETEAPQFPESAETIAEEEEPAVLTREEMGYDIVFNTTISCLITNAALTKSQANKLASILHDAYARAIKPVHGTMDGDTVFVLATGKQQVNFDAFAALATDVMQYAIIDGAMSAEGAYGLPAARDMQK